MRQLVHESGITTLYVTHDQEEALALSVRLAVMHEGAIQQTGTPVEVYLSPANAFIARFMGHTNFIEGQVITADRHCCTIAINGANETIVGPPIDRKISDTVLMILRPESLQIEDQMGTPSRHRNRWSAAIATHEFRGTFTAYTLHLFGQDILLYQTTHEHQLHRGNVTVSIPPDQVLILPAES